MVRGLLTPFVAVLDRQYLISIHHPEFGLNGLIRNEYKFMLKESDCYV
jgi:hypothetical protein